MVHWKKLFGLDGNDRQGMLEEARRLLPWSRDDTLESAFPAREVTMTALRLRELIIQCIPIELEPKLITMANSKVITKKVVLAAKEAGGKDYGDCVVFCLLINIRWFKKQAKLELWDSDLHEVRATAAEIIAKELIEGEEKVDHLNLDILLKRFSIVVDGKEIQPANVIEKAVDLHALHVSGSSGYQKCVDYLWRGWVVQDEQDPSTFVKYGKMANPSYWAHVHPDLMRAPIYQNATQIMFSFIFLALFSQVVATVNPTGEIDVIEIILYVFTFGFLCDEFAKLWKVGTAYIGFWNVFNLVLYALLTTSLVVRLIALSHDVNNTKRKDMNELSYNFLAFSAPMFWMRLLLYLDTIRFFGAMLVVLKVMMKESLIFFALLTVIVIGFLQAFIGMDNADSNTDATVFILQSMFLKPFEHHSQAIVANAVMQSPDFSGFDNFAPPFGIILYYIFTFVVMVILLNILIALYNSAYEDITEEADDEYMALFAQKTMQFVRAPDENVFIAPFNLIELFFLILPLEWWFPKAAYAKLNDYVMAVIYSPLLIIAAWFESRSAKQVKANQLLNRDDDDTVQEWEQMDDEVDFAHGSWGKTIASVKPNVEDDTATIAVRELKEEIKELKELVLKLVEKKGGEKKGENNLVDVDN